MIAESSDQACSLVTSQGLLYIAIYNDQGMAVSLLDDR